MEGLYTEKQCNSSYFSNGHPGSPAENKLRSKGRTSQQESQPRQTCQGRWWRGQSSSMEVLECGQILESGAKKALLIG